MTSSEQKWLTLSQAATRLGVHPTTLRRWADNGDIPVTVTPGGHRRFLVADIDARLKLASSPAPDDHAVHLDVYDDHASRAWADFALVETRQRLISKPEPHWLTAFDEDDRSEKRELGRRLMSLLMQHVSTPHDDQGLLIEARSIATRYAQNCAMVGLSAAESLEATTFFRDTMTEVALQMPHVARLDDDVRLRLLRKLNEIFNIVQVGVVEYFDELASSNRK